MRITWTSFPWFPFDFQILKDFDAGKAIPVSRIRHDVKAALKPFLGLLSALLGDAAPATSGDTSLYRFRAAGLVPEFAGSNAAGYSEIFLRDELCALVVEKNCLSNLYPVLRSASGFAANPLYRYPRHKGRVPP
jgi:hypothetical protein